MNNGQLSVFRVSYIVNPALRLFIWALFMTGYLINENLTETANYPSKVLSYVQPTWLSRKLKSSVQSEVAGRIIRTVWHVPLVSVLTR